MAQLQPLAHRLQMKIKHGDAIGLGWDGPKIVQAQPISYRAWYLLDEVKVQLAKMVELRGFSL